MAVWFADPYRDDPLADGTIHTESLGVDMFWRESMISKTLAGGVPTKSIDWRHGMFVGTILRDVDTGKCWVVREIKPAKPDDWFDGSLVAICTQPWNEVKSILRQKITWLEDMLMPHVTG